jgi:nucleotide-binding universal stress UspA family protein
MQPLQQTSSSPSTFPWQGCARASEKDRAFTKFKNILFATDLSASAEKALPYAVDLARRYDSTVYAVHVYQPDFFPVAAPYLVSETAQAEENLREEGKRELEKKLNGLSHELVFLEGAVWMNLSKITTEKDINLIVIGTHGRARIEKAAMGSVAEEIFRQATCPVLTVGPHVQREDKPAPAVELNRILYATDFSPESLAAAPYAISLAAEHRAQLILMHAIQKLDTAQINSAFQTLRDVVPLGTWLALQPRYVVERGVPDKTILGIAARHNADLIVLGVRSAKNHLVAATHFASSTAYKVITQAECPVLTIRG